MKRKLLAGLLSIALVFSMLCSTAMAEGDPRPDENCPFQVVDFGLPKNEADGVSMKFWFNNRSNKVIKYIYITATPYNRVGDPTYCTVSGESQVAGCITSPIRPESDYDGLSYRNGIFNYWEAGKDKNGYYRILEEQAWWGTKKVKHYLTEDELKNYIYRHCFTLENVWYNSTISDVHIDSIRVVYMDNTEQIVPPEEAFYAYFNTHTEFFRSVMIG